MIYMGFTNLFSQNQCEGGSERCAWYKHGRSSMDAEVRRLKNRVRQQRYRARKREEKAKKNSYVSQGDQNASHGAFPECLPLLGMPNIANSLPVSKHNMSSAHAKPIQEKNQNRQLEGDDSCKNENRGCADQGYGGTEKCHEGSDPRPIESRQQQQTAHIVEMVVQGDTDTSHGSYQPSYPALKPLNNLEDGHHVNTPIKHGCSKGHDIMARRLKNRERQRRYRARKRLEADMKNVGMGNQLILQPNKCEVLVKLKSHVHHRRDWKKDARHAHKMEEPKGPPIETPVPTVNSESETAAHGLHIQEKVPLLGVFHLEHSVSPSGNEPNDSLHGRRHWKAAARNKVD